MVRYGATGGEEGEEGNAILKHKFILIQNVVKSLLLSVTTSSSDDSALEATVS